MSKKTDVIVVFIGETKLIQFFNELETTPGVQNKP